MAFNYTSRTYGTIKSDLLARASLALPEWTDRDPSDFMMQLIELWAYAGDSMHYYIDRGAGEAFLPTAQMRESVLAHANLFDYIPSNRVSATSTITVFNNLKDDDDNPLNVDVPMYTRFTIQHDGKTHNVYSTGNFTLPPGSSKIQVAEGEIVQERVLTASSSGRDRQSYTLPRIGVVVPSIVVRVYETEDRPVIYQYIDRLINANSGDRVFSTRTNSDGYTEITFGSSINGTAPFTGTEITATYATSKGSGGNFPAKSSEFVSWFSAPIVGVSIRGSDTFTGGTDEESIASMKANIPNTIASQNRAVTKQDFVALTTQVPGVSKVAVEYLPPLGIDPDTGAVPNGVVKLYPHSFDSDYLVTDEDQPYHRVSPTIAAEIIATVAPRALLGVDVTVATQVDWTAIDIQMTVHVNRRFVNAWVKADVMENLDRLFMFDDVFFGQKLHLGQVYQFALSVDGVDYVTIERFSSRNAEDDAPDPISFPSADPPIIDIVAQDIQVSETELPKKGTVVVNVMGGIQSRDTDNDAEGG